MGVAPMAGPLPGDLVLHTCGGVVRKWQPAGSHETCRCGEPLAGELDPVEGHALFFCTTCKRWIGICAAGELAEVATAAERILVSHDRYRRKKGPDI